MMKIVAVMGWVVAVAALIMTAMLALGTNALREEIRELRETNDILTGRLTEISVAEQMAASVHEQGQADVLSLQEKLSEAELEMASLAEALEATRQAYAAEGESLDDEEEGGEEEDTEEAVQQQKAIARVQVSALIDMTYGTFFGERTFPPEIEEAVRDLLVTYGVETQRLVAEARKNERVAKDVADDLGAYKAALRDELAGVISAEEVAAWEEYEPYADQYLYENLVEGQLTMLASGLTAENRAIAKTVIAQELVAHIEAFENSDLAYTTRNHFDSQEDALNVSVEQLREVLDGEQLAFIEGYRDRAVAQFQALAPAD
jgi:hypothetical protein